MAIHMAEKKWNSGELKRSISFSGLQAAKRNPALPMFSPNFPRSASHMQVYDRNFIIAHMKLCIMRSTVMGALPSLPYGNIVMSARAICF